jgi:hypothetical protein
MENETQKSVSFFDKFRTIIAITSPFSENGLLIFYGLLFFATHPAIDSALFCIIYLVILINLIFYKEAATIAVEKISTFLKSKEDVNNFFKEKTPKFKMREASQDEIDILSKSNQFKNAAIHSAYLNYQHSTGCKRFTVVFIDNNETKKLKISFVTLKPSGEVFYDL